MADINEYFPNAKIRTLKSDLESLKQSGGSFAQQKEVKIDKEDFFLPQQKKEEAIAPPILEIRPLAPTTNNPVSRQKIGSLEQSLADQQIKSNRDISSEATRDVLNPKLILILGLSLILILGLSLGFWLIYPKIIRPLANLPTPTPSQNIVPTPSPSPEAPVLVFRAAIEKFPIILNSLETEELTQKLKTNILLPQTINTLVSFEPKQGSGNYFSGEDLIKIISPNSLSSFKSAINKEYLILGYWETENRPNLNLVFTIKPESIETTRSFVQSWETANMEEFFPIIFLPQLPEKRQTEVFKNVKIASIEARSITINQQRFIYAILADKLIVSPSEKSFELIIKNL